MHLSRADKQSVLSGIGTEVRVAGRSEIHNTQHRMPAILEKADREAWLTGTPEEAWEALTPYPDDLMVAWPVSTRVNTPKNNDASLVQPDQ